MRPLAASELLDVWERGRSAPPWQQALLLLAAACPEDAPGTLARLSIGRRDARLLKLRAWTFGPQLYSVVACPACDERLEFTMDSEAILEEAVQAPEVVDFQAAGFQGKFRLPNTEDLISVIDLQNREEARQALLAACLVEVSPAPVTNSPGEESPEDIRALPPDVQDAIARCMQEADPQADIEIDLACPACDHRWTASFDIVSFFWEEIDDWAWRTLREVHILASVYGWSENQILSMSAWRRRVYLEIVQA